jgi:hypothetical protein
MNTIASPPVQTDLKIRLSERLIIRISDRLVSHDSSRFDAIDGNNMLWYTIATLATENEFEHYRTTEMPCSVITKSRSFSRARGAVIPTFS